jgi:signal transduction histidine kinase
MAGTRTAPLLLVRRAPAVRTALPVAGAGLAVLLYAGAVVLAAVPPGTPGVAAGDDVWFAAWLVCALAGGVLARSAAGGGYGRLLLGTGLCALTGFAADVAGTALPAGGAATALVLAHSVLVDVPQVLLLGLCLLRFPDGRPPAGRAVWRWLDRGAWVLVAVLAAADLVRPGPLEDGAPRNPLGIPALRAALDVVDTAALLALLVLLLGGFAAVAVRWRRGGPLERRAVAVFLAAAGWLIAVALTEAVASALDLRVGPVLGAVAEALAICALPVAALTTTLRRVVFDAELVLNRNLTYLLLTVVVVGGYAGTVTVLGRVLDDRSTFGLSLLVTGAIAVLFGPLKVSIQRGVETVLLGRRSSPYTALTALGRSIDASLTPSAALEGAVRTVAETFRLPYVELRVDVDDEPRLVAAAGRPCATTVEVPLLQRGEPRGSLRLAPRSPHERLTARDERLLAEFATHIAGAVEAVRLTEQLRSSRAALVRASEEERRRIRSELHDGIGPVLASTVLAVQRVERHLDPGDARRETLAESRQDVQVAIDDIRRLVHGLGPASLAELGLAGALRQRAAALSDSVVIEVDVDDAAARLPVATEVAAYRMATEAMTNAVRHSAARTCRVTVRADDLGLTLEIADDGTGIPAGAPAGIGLASMRERAAELGGRLEVASSSAGTRISAWLPR